MPRFWGRCALFTTTAAVIVALSGSATPAFAAAKRKAKAAKRKKAVAAERLVSATKRGQPNVQAAGSLVIDETGAVVYAHNPDHERPIASISKLAAMLALSLWRIKRWRGWRPAWQGLRRRLRPRMAEPNGNLPSARPPL